jgi:ATP-dependent DNA ligase
MRSKKIKATFIEPMLLLATGSLPDGSEWEYEVKLDGYRSLALKSAESFTCDRETIKTSR